MINIHEKLWVAIKPEKGSLAYMTHYKKDSAFENRKRTGLNWSGIKEDKAELHDNLPTKGFVIAESVSRWSTQNKVFRVIDPRGFTVEVPTGNISTLLGCTTVIEGVVQEECVWGREASNHILLPVGSDPYLKSKEDTKTNSEMISFSKLDEGDVVKMHIEGEDYQYLGKFKMEWSIKSMQAISRSVGYGWMNSGWHRNSSIDRCIDKEEFTDNKWRHLFVDNSGKSYKLKASGKCIKKSYRSSTLPALKVGAIGVEYTPELSTFLDGGDYELYKTSYKGVYSVIEQCGFIKK